MVWRRLFRKQHEERRLDSEVRFHLEQEIERNIAAGMSPHDALRAARIEFGGLESIKEQCRESMKTHIFETLLQDASYALRTMRRSPAFAIISVLTLALGIGANTAIFSVVEAALLKNLPYPQPDRLVQLWEAHPQDGRMEQSEASWPDFMDWKSQDQIFEHVGGYQFGGRVTLSIANSSPQKLSAATATSDFFSVLGTQPQMGRTFLPEEEVPGTNRAVVLSHQLWQQTFGGDPDIVGKKISLEGAPFTVVGVLPASFQFAEAGDTDIWLPVQASERQRTRSYWHWLNVVGRLRPGIALHQAQIAMNGLAGQIAEKDPKYHKGTQLRLVPLQDQVLGPVRQLLLVLLAAVTFVLLICCSNVAGLVLARSASRMKEISIRQALGAGKRRIVQQILTESLLLSAIGTIVGLFLAQMLVRVLVSGIPVTLRIFMPYLQQVGLDGRVLAFTLVTSVLTGILFGVAPALQLARRDPQAQLKQEGRTSHSSARQGLRALLVGAEFATALMLLVGAGLMLKSTLRVLREDPGFNISNLLTARLSLPAAKYPHDPEVAAFHREILSRVEVLPGVTGVATVSRLPLSGGGDSGTLTIVGRPVAPDEQTRPAHVRSISPSYFHTMGIPLLRGREFTDHDGVGAPLSVLVNQKLVQRYFSNQDPIGQKISFKWSPGPWEIVGVVADERVVAPDAEVTSVVYFSALQQPDSEVSLIVRTRSDPTSLVNSIRHEVSSMDPAVVLSDVTTMEQMIAGSSAVFMRRYPALLIGAFAGTALLLALIGIYGLVSYSVVQQTHEIGIRLALGARRSNVMMLIVGRNFLLAAGGVAVGTLGALLLTRFLSSLLFGVKPSDPATFVEVSAVLTLAGLVGSYIPARRAARVDPMVVLRHD